MPDTKPYITVLMPAYNAGPYIHEAIESILNQTYTDFEFLIINDGSKDETLSVIKRYNDPRIVLVDQPNKGLITSLNEGIMMSQGVLIARMDADDVCLPDRLQLQVDFLENNSECIMVGGEANVMDKDGNFLMHLVPPGHTYEEIKAAVDYKCPFIHPCVTFYKQAALQAGLYPKNAWTFEDHLFWKKLMEIGVVCNTHDIVLDVRFNPESVTIDEKWRGKLFTEIRRRSIHNGFVTDDDAMELRAIISGQNLEHYKQASYYSMIAKKYLWNNPDAAQARINLRKAIHYFPKNPNSYILYLFSFLPATVRTNFYKLFKKKPK